MTASSALLPALVVTRVFCLFNSFAAFPLVALRTPRFTNWLLSASNPNWQAICRSWCGAPCSCFSAVAAVASHVLGASFSTSLYASIVQLDCASAPFKMTSKLPRNDIELRFTVRYSIKNPWLGTLI